METTHLTRAESTGQCVIRERHVPGGPSVSCNQDADRLARKPRSAADAAIIGRDYTDLPTCPRHGTKARAKGQEVATFDHLDALGGWGKE